MESRFPKEGSIPEFLAALASPDDAHGVLAAGAIAAAMGVALLQRTASLPHALADGNDQEHVGAIATLVRIEEELLETVETQTLVNLFAARSLPQASQAEHETREKALQLALRAAADVPLEVMRLCVSALQRAETVAGRRGRGAAAEIELAVALLETAFNSARSNLEAKLPILTDTPHVAWVGEQVARLSHDASTAAKAVRCVTTVPPT